MPRFLSLNLFALDEIAKTVAGGQNTWDTTKPAHPFFFTGGDFLTPEKQTLTYAVRTTKDGTHSEFLGPMCDSEVRKAVKGDPRGVQFFEDPLLVTGRNSKKTVLGGDPLWEDKGGYVIYRPSQPHNAIVHQDPRLTKGAPVPREPFIASALLQAEVLKPADTAQKISLVKDNGELAWGASKLKRYLKNLAVADQSGKVIGFASEPQCLEKAMYDPTSFRLLHDPMIATGPNKEEMWLATNDIRVKSLTEKWSCVKFFKPSERESSQKWLKDQTTSGSVRYSKSAKSVAENFSRGEDIKYDVQPQRVEFAEDPTAILKRYPTDDKKEDSEKKLNRRAFLPHCSFRTNGGDTFAKLAAYLELQNKRSELNDRPQPSGVSWQREWEMPQTGFVSGERTRLSHSESVRPPAIQPPAPKKERAWQPALTYIQAAEKKHTLTQRSAGSLPAGRWAPKQSSSDVDQQQRPARSRSANTDVASGWRRKQKEREDDDSKPESIKVDTHLCVKTLRARFEPRVQETLQIRFEEEY